MRELLLVGAGGFVGAACRYGISWAMRPFALQFPWPTLLINVLGCFLIGLLLPWLQGRPWGVAFLVTGVLGGFTTFSAFGHETHALAARGQEGLAAVYVAASVLGGLGAVWIGRWMIK